ncbi:MAG: RHS repeat-associated core domain-containing protein [Clostridia bacterium]|nr:RHS repeat-associated core domain-containing protein [Clostridia bacterium]
MGQLTREDNRPMGKSYTYTYDNAGNRLSKTTYAFTVGTLGTAEKTETYTYADETWGDLLTGFGDRDVAYDAIGNPITIGVYDDSTQQWISGAELAWSGRQLTQYRTFERVNGVLVYGETITYTYNAEGIRTGQTSTSDGSYEYLLNGSQVVAMLWTDTEGVSHSMVFLYDETGSPYGFTGTEGTYYYEKNLQGDIVGLFDGGFWIGQRICTYTYDAWGNATVTMHLLYDYIIPEHEAAATLNPFRYRSYFYDTQTGFYYLNSRYYHPEWGRFLNADENLYGHLWGFNLFLYCYNDPIIYIDPTGENAVDIFNGWIIGGSSLILVDGSLPVGDIIYIGGTVVLGVVAVGVSIGTYQNYVDVQVESSISITTPSDSIFVNPPSGIEDVPSAQKDTYDPDPYARPGQKRQGRELKGKGRRNPNFEPRNNRRDNRPAKPKKHTPGRDHKKHFSIDHDMIKIFMR